MPTSRSIRSSPRYLNNNGGVTIATEQHVSISKGNSKMGDLQSVSLPAIVTCRDDCACAKKCYALRMARRRPSVKNAYDRNYDILINNPEQYWREVEASVMMSRFFRFHVSGDIPNSEYFEHMVSVAQRNPHCEILCFTKKYDIVNAYASDLPSNLHIVFSAWRGLQMDNPHNLPEAHVRYRNGETTASPNAVECGGNCTECAIHDGGCWTLKNGEQVVFNEH